MGCNQTKNVDTKDTAAQTGGTDSSRRPSYFETDGDVIEPRRRDVTHVCLTGGPCAGKSTALSLLLTKLPQRAGIKVFCVPEAATLMVGGGMDWADASTNETRIEYQLALLRTQLALEDSFLQIARAYGKPAVVVSDRGTMDGRAFCSEQEFEEILLRGGYTLEHLRDTRYDAVLHMVTAAKGADEYYNFDNPARHEDVDGARVTDDRLRNVYIGHSNVKLFDNSGSFDSKLDRVFDAVLETCGHVPVAHHRTRRYVCNNPNEADIDVPFVHMTVTVTILAGSNADNVKMLLQRKQGLSSVYFYQLIHKTKKPDGEVEVIKQEHRISQREYYGLILQQDSKREVIIKNNISFMWKDNYYEVGCFVAPSRFVGQAIVYVDCKEGEELPPFISDARDVTNDSEYSSYSMSHSSGGAAAVSPSASSSGGSPGRGKEKTKSPKDENDSSTRSDKDKNGSADRI